MQSITMGQPGLFFAQSRHKHFPKKITQSQILRNPTEVLLGFLLYSLNKALLIRHRDCPFTACGTGKGTNRARLTKATLYYAEASGQDWHFRRVRGILENQAPSVARLAVPRC